MSERQIRLELSVVLRESSLSKVSKNVCRKEA